MIVACMGAFNPWSPGGLFIVKKMDITSPVLSFNPFTSIGRTGASIGRTGTSKAKVEVRDICLNISFMT